MVVRCFLLLLSIFYKVNSDTSSKYPPCDNNIVFAYDNTFALDEAAYKKEVNFLTNYVFEDWNNFVNLTLYSDGNDVFKTDFKNKAELKGYILNNKQVKAHVGSCDVFTALYYKRTPDFASFIIFLREFSDEDVDMMCGTVIHGLDSGNNLILFVPLTSAVNVNDLKGYFPKATILVWDEHEDTPNDWKKQFDRNFGCDPQTTKITTKMPTTILITSTEDPLTRYPCNNNIFIGYETTTELAASRYHKQINFLANMLFENWTHFDVSLLSCGKNIFKTGFKSKSDVTGFIANDVQVKTTFKTCETFSHINFHTFDSINIVLFLRKFNQKDVYDCKSIIDAIKGHVDSLTFVPLSSEVIIEELEAFFPTSKIIKWDIDSEDAPNDWESQFYDAYGCNPQPTTITHPITTTENPVNRYPCENDIIIAYDKSNKLNKNEFKRLQNFLVDYVFKDWTSSFNNLTLVSFADNETRDEFGYLKTKKMLESFILNDKQVDKTPSLCQIFKRLMKSSNIVFTSEFTAEDITEDCKLSFTYPDENVQIDLLSEYYPQAQIIKWNMSGEIPKNWEWQFTEAYNCKKHDQKMYPCDSKILIGYDESTEILNELQIFLTQTVFTSSWAVFEDLELVAYSEDMRIQSFGSMNNLNDVHDFINNGTETRTKTSLCRVFYELASTYTLGVNIVLFVSEFRRRINDECPLWIKKVRNNANSITFIVMSKNVDTNYLLSKIPHANFISWNILEEKVPTDWENQFFSAFGCESFSVESQTYPCLNEIAIGFDKSRYLSPFAYQRLTNFLLTKLFIDEWTNFVGYTLLASYADDTEHVYPVNLLQLKYFIHQILKSKEEPKLCEAFKILTTKPVYLILFVSKFDEDVLSSDCIKHEKLTVDSRPKQITFIALTPSVNETYIMEIFPTALVISWDIEQEQELTNWTQALWESFGCEHLSPIQFPHSTSTVVPTTLSIPTTTYTTFKTTEFTSTKRQSTTETAQTEVSTTSSKTTNKQKEKSNEQKILLGVFIPIIILFLIAFAVGMLWCRRKNRQNLVAQMVFNTFYKTHELFDETREEDPWMINPDFLQINFIDKLGSGAFGDVYLGKLLGDAPIKHIYSDSPHCQRFHDIDVAVKALPAMSVDGYARSEFQKEIAFMKELKCHVNVICFLGYVSDPTNPLMLLEYCENGDLLKFIKTNKQKFIESFETQDDSDSKTLISFGWQISSGLEHLSSINIIHRDIAARNILLDKNNICKISDFGLCRNSDSQLYLSSGGKLPIRWMAPESLKENVFSTKTDVWSYGVLLWELFTLGQIPYAHVDNVLKYLDDGKRLEKPEHCSEELYDLMSSCWKIDPNARSTFTVISQMLKKKMENSTLHYNYVDVTFEQIDELNSDNDETNV